jgi:predicted lipoprotein
MQKKFVRYAVAGIIFILIAVNSVYFRKLSDVEREKASGKIDISKYANKVWGEIIIPSFQVAPDIVDLYQSLKTNPDQAFSKYSHSLGIGNIKYLMVKGRGKVVSINEDNLDLAINFDQKQLQVSIETEFIYGNAIRDAAGKIKLDEFENTMELNNLSAELNKRVRDSIIPVFINNVKINDMIIFSGVLELNNKYLDLSKIELLPVRLEVEQED